MLIRFLKKAFLVGKVLENSNIFYKIRKTRQKLVELGRNPNSIRIPIGFPIQVSGTIVGVFSSNVLNYDEQMVFISKKMGMSLFSSNQIANNFEIRTYPHASLSDIKRSSPSSSESSISISL